MNRKCLLICLLILIILGIVSTSCKKDNSGNNTTAATNIRKVKYEITGPYTNNLLLVFTEISGGLESIRTTLPWTKEMTYNASVAGIGIGGNSEIPTSVLDAGKVITIKIYSGGKLVKTNTAIADAKGIINLPTIPFIF